MMDNGEWDTSEFTELKQELLEILNMGQINSCKEK
jgi:hypothetical protein